MEAPSRIALANRQVRVVRIAVGAAAVAAFVVFGAVARAAHPGSAAFDDIDSIVVGRRLEPVDVRLRQRLGRPLDWWFGIGGEWWVMSSFRAIGCEVVLSGGPNAAVRELFEQRDACFSRFRADSELNRVNSQPEGVAFLSEEFAAMLGLALDAARATEGVVTPTVGAALAAAGYDRDFVELCERDEPAFRADVPSTDALSLRGRMLVRAIPVELDLNGVVKGKTVDDALALIGPGWVSAGGDLATTVPVSVGVPGGDAVTLYCGGLATSSTVRRSWQRGGERQHHLIDPSTGRPSETRWQDVTAVAGSCLAADVAAKAALLLDARGPEWLEQRGLPGRFVDRAGDVHVNASWCRLQRGALIAA